MDKIASSLVVSKRTIYEQFEGKEELVKACMEEYKKERDAFAECLRSQTENSFQFLLEIFKDSFNMFQKINLQFFSDIESMFPNHIEHMKMNKPAQLLKFRNLIAESQEDGYIEKSLSPEVLSVVYYGMLYSLRDKEAYDFSKNSVAEVLRVLVITFFKGVASPKGLKMIEKYEKEFDREI